MSTVRITRAGRRGTVEIDGIDLSQVASDVSIRMSPREPTEVELTLTASDARLALFETEVTLDAATVELLTVLGWTPPAEVVEEVSTP